MFVSSESLDLREFENEKNLVFDAFLYPKRPQSEKNGFWPKWPTKIDFLLGLEIVRINGKDFFLGDAQVC